MSKTFRPWDVDQQWMLPPSLHEFVPAGHVAHFIRETVRSDLDLGAILSAYQEERGFPPYHPAMMTALLLYGYSRGVYSSRKLAQACEERLDFMAVTAMNKPDFRTIAAFRRRHLEALAGLFLQALKLCQAAELVQLGHVALDGTKIQANASVRKAMSYGRMRVAEKKLAAEIEGWFKAAETSDTQEDGAHGSDRRGDEMPDWVADKVQRLERIRAARAALEAEAKEPPSDDEDGPGPSSGMMRKGKPDRGKDGGPPDAPNATSPTPTAAFSLRRRASPVTTLRSPSMRPTRSSSPSTCRPTPMTAARSSLCSAQRASHCMPIPARSPLMPAIAPRPICFTSNAAGSPAMSPPGAPDARRPVRANALRPAGSARWRSRYALPAIAAAIACANRSSSRSSAR